jgi:uncharacterized protein with von Willebrand factor type A (vWA) domain
MKQGMGPCTEGANKMAKYALNTFSFNKELNEALKTRFGAKWNGSEWSVSSKAKLAEANALIAEVVAFENERAKEEERFQAPRVMHELHPESGIFAPHPLTGERWSRRLTSEEKEEWTKIKAGREAAAKADQMAAEAKQAAIKAAAEAAAEAEQAASLAAVAPELKRAAQVVAEAVIVKAKAAVLTQDLAGGVINYAAILSAQQRMARAAREVGRQARLEYREAQKEIEAVWAALKAAGLRSDGINQLINMNFNRPDRDRPLSVTRAQIYKITKREPEFEETQDA